MQVQAHVDDGEKLQQLTRWTIAFPKVLMWHIRDNCDLTAELQVSVSIVSMPTASLSCTTFALHTGLPSWTNGESLTLLKAGAVYWVCRVCGSGHASCF